jgi:SLT domain-containing protein
MNQESGGNPSIVNTTDSNWAAGTPSVGLMQVIGPTYQANKDPRFDVGPYLPTATSIDPMANITAAIRYTERTYGSLSAWGQAGWL